MVTIAATLAGATAGSVVGFLLLPPNSLRMEVSMMVTATNKSLCSPPIVHRRFPPRRSLSIAFVACAM